MDLLALVDFNLVARHGGFGRAARATGRPKATLSRRVADLEASLDLRLFERGARALKLTQEGQALFERTGALLGEIDETAAAIASGGGTPRCCFRRPRWENWPPRSPKNIRKSASRSRQRIGRWIRSRRATTW
jgi:DNA-binding transcriptional LysR family regulator